MAKRILVIDDSALVRRQLTSLLQENGYETDTAKNGREGVEKALAEEFDAITMDINMPEMDGLSAVKRIMDKKPTAIVMISSLTTEDAGPTVEALELGAVDFVAKPGTFSADVEKNGKEILAKIAAAVRIPKRRLHRRIPPPPVEKAPIRERRNRLVRERTTLPASGEEVKSVVLVGASTGGPGLIEEICASLPADFPHPVCVVQHMPEKFTAAFAARLDRASKLTVKESEHNEPLLPGVVYVAKGGEHLHFAKKVSGRYVIRHGVAKTKRFFTPSVDEMYLSASEIFPGGNLFAVLLTGIGDDGAAGMLEIKNKGGRTIAESEETATVYGMPREAAERGAAQEVLPFPKIVQKIAAYR